MTSAAPTENGNASDHSANDLLKTVLMAAATGGVVQLSKSAVTYVWQQITTSRPAYSVADLTALNKLKQIYAEHLEDKEIPDEWILDEENRARYYFEPRPWSHLIKREAKKRDTFGILHSYVKAYVSVASGFLRARQTQRYLNKGYAGDYIELFFATEVHWGLNVLSSYDASEQTLQLVSARIQYLQAVLDEKVFSASWLAYQDTHLSTCIKMREILRDCREYMEYMSHLFGAREHLAKLKVYNEELLSTLFNYLYLLRDKEVFLPLSVNEWITIDQKSIEEINSRHHDLFNTHTGAMLRSLLQISGPSALGWGGCKATSLSYAEEYFSNSAGRLSIYSAKRKPGVPFWISESNQTEKFLAQYHACCQALMSLARIQRLVAISHELTGMQGDLWAYGTEDGRSAVSLICDLVREQTRQVKRILSEMHEYSNGIKESLDERLTDEARHIARDARYAYEELDKYCKHINVTLVALETQMEIFPARNLDERESLRVKLYEQINQCINDNRPDLQDRRIVIDWVEPVETDHVMAEVKASSFDEEEAPLPVINLKLSLPIRNENGFLSLQNCVLFPHALTATELNRARAPWKLGDSDIDWANGFIDRHREIILDYQLAYDTISTKIAELAHLAELERKPRIDEIKRVQLQLAILLQKLQDRLDSQKPGWRFYYLFGLVPLYPISWGWPFVSNQAQNFYHIVSEMINTRLIQLENRVLEGIQSIPLPISKSRSQQVAILLEPESKSQPQLVHQLEPDSGSEPLAEERIPAEAFIPTSVARILSRLTASPAPIPSVEPMSPLSPPSPRVSKPLEADFDSPLLISVLDPLEFLDLGETMPLTPLTKALLYLLSSCNATPLQIDLVQRILPTQSGVKERKYLEILLFILKSSRTDPNFDVVVQQYLDFVEEEGEAEQLAVNDTFISDIPEKDRGQSCHI